MTRNYLQDTKKNTLLIMNTLLPHQFYSHKTILLQPVTKQEYIHTLSLNEFYFRFFFFFFYSMFQIRWSPPKLSLSLLSVLCSIVLFSYNMLIFKSSCISRTAEPINLKISWKLHFLPSVCYIKFCMIKHKLRNQSFLRILHLIINFLNFFF